MGGGWPGQVKALEKAGKLLPAVLEAAQREAETYSRARTEGNSHLADHEIAQLYGLSPEPPPA